MTTSPPILLRRDLLAAGRTDTEIRTLVRRGDLVRLAPASFVAGDAYRVLDPDEQHRLEVRAVAGHRTGGLLVSHASAAALYGLPLVRARLDEVHLTRTGRGGSRLRGRVRVHSAVVPQDSTSRLDGTPITSVARTLVDLARTQPVDTAVAAADAALHRRLVRPEQVAAALRQCSRHKGAPRARRAMLLADGRAESPGETLTRLILRAADLGDLELQAWVLDERGRRVGRVDLAYLACGVLIGFDGLVKYGRLLRPGQTASAAVVAEKRREELLTELGWLVIRVVWSDLDDPDRLVRRVAAACTARERLVRAGAIRGGAEPTGPVTVPAAPELRRGGSAHGGPGRDRGWCAAPRGSGRSGRSRCPR